MWVLFFVVIENMIAFFMKRWDFGPIRVVLIQLFVVTAIGQVPLNIF